MTSCSLSCSMSTDRSLFLVLLQAQLMSSMPLPPNPVSRPAPVPSSMTSQNRRTAGSDADVQTFVQNYIPLFSAPEVASDHAVPRLLPPDALPQCLSAQHAAASALTGPSRVDEAFAPSVITHTASSTLTSSHAATTFCHGTDYSSLPTPVLPPPPHLQPSVSVPSAAGQQAHSFTVPHPIQPSSKKPSVQRAALSSSVSSPHLILRGLSFLLSRLNQMSKSQFFPDIQILIYIYREVSLSVYFPSAFLWSS